METKIEHEFSVNGMTCDHCSSALSDALIAIDGVQSVDVNATTGRVLLRNDRPVTLAAVEDIISETGFEIISWQERLR